MKPKSKHAAARSLREGWSFNKALGLFYRGGRALYREPVISKPAKLKPANA